MLFFQNNLLAFELSEILSYMNQLHINTSIGYGYKQYFFPFAKFYSIFEYLMKYPDQCLNFLYRYVKANERSMLPSLSKEKRKIYET